MTGISNMVELIREISTSGMDCKMSDINSKKNKHLTIDDRLEIQECLNHGMTFKAIAKRIGKDQTTVSKEVKKHLSMKEEDVKRFDKDGKPLIQEICPSLIIPYNANQRSWSFQIYCLQAFA